MVHTISFNVSLSRHELNIITNKFNITSKCYEDLSRFINYEGITLIYKREDKSGPKIFLHIDCIELLGRSNISVNDFEFIEGVINDIRMELFLYNKEFKLSRIDYRYDIVIKNLEVRKVLFNIYNKYFNKAAYMEKVDIRKKYKTSNADTSIRYKNGSKALNIYDKEEERKDRNQPIMDYERDVIRFEAQVNSSRINYLNKKYGLKSKLKDYFTENIYNICMKDSIIKVIYMGNYYNKYHAFKIIDNSDNTSKEKENMKGFLLTVANMRSLERGKKEYKNRYRIILKNLEKLNINPVLIPKNTLITKIENPIKDILLKK